jgi:predicted RNase H-like nuclease (RuvC/YqgF family)
VDIQEIIAKFKRGEEITFDELRFLAESYFALVEKNKELEAKNRELDARIEALERERDELQRELEVKRAINKMLSTIVWATRGVFSEN